MNSKIRKRELRFNVFHVQVSTIVATVCGSPWALERHSQARTVVVYGCIAKLNVEEECPGAGSPIIQRYRKYILIHQHRGRLPGTELTQFRVGVDEVKCSLAQIVSK